MTPIEASHHLFKNEVVPFFAVKEIPKSAKIKVAVAFVDYKAEVVDFSGRPKIPVDRLREGYKKILCLIEETKKKYAGSEGLNHE